MPFIPPCIRAWTLRLIKAAALLLLSLFAFIALSCVLAGRGFVGEEHLLQGITFVPWLYMAIVGGVLTALQLAVRLRWAAGATVALFFTYFSLCGDWHIPEKTGSPANSASEPRTLSVVTLNLQYFKSGVKKVAKSIRSMDADVFLLSEVTLSRAELAELQAELGPWTFEMGKQFETAIATRLPLLDVREVELPARQASLSIGNHIDDQPFNPSRSLLHARVQFDGHPISIISVRFIAGRPAERNLMSSLEWGQYLLTTQRREVEFLKTYVKAIQEPVIFGGDLNATPGSNIIRKVNSFAQDSYMTAHILGKSTFPTYKRPGFRLDYIFHTEGLSVARSEVLPVIASDHFPVRSDFFLVRHNPQ